MKVLIILVLLFSSSVFAEDIAIEAVKSHPRIVAYLADKSVANEQVRFSHMELGGHCGFTGCQWRKLVSVILTSKSANASSTTIIALVSGHTPNNFGNTSVEFVEIVKLADNILPTKKPI